MKRIRWKRETEGKEADVSPLVALIVTPKPDTTDWLWAVLVYARPDSDRDHGSKIWAAEGKEPAEFKAKLAAVEAWRRWAREQAIAAGFVVTDPVELEVGGEG